MPTALIINEKLLNYLLDQRLTYRETIKQYDNWITAHGYPDKYKISLRTVIRFKNKKYGSDPK